MTSVKCDYPNCDFESDIAFENLTPQQCVEVMKADWLDTPCPKCGRGVIINESEITMLETLIELEKLGLLSLDGQTTPEHDTSFTINIGALRPESEETEFIKINK